jgi:hypothetical protein
MKQPVAQSPKTAKSDQQRAAARYATDASVACRPFSSRGGDSADAVMRNFSKGGAYIETGRAFKIGTICQLRMVQYPVALRSVAPDDRPRSACLAVVQWRQTLTPDNEGPYGYGLRQLD